MRGLRATLAAVMSRRERDRVSPSTTVSRCTRAEDLPQLVSVEELAAWLDIGRALAYELVRRGELQSVRLGRLIRIPRTALAKWIGDDGVMTNGR